MLKNRPLTLADERTGSELSSVLGFRSFQFLHLWQLQTTINPVRVLLGRLGCRQIAELENDPWPAHAVFSSIYTLPKNKTTGAAKMFFRPAKLN